MAALQITRQVQSALRLPHHWQFASSRHSSAASLECMHATVLSSLGFPLASREHAAFHPIFWLHAANLDRIYQLFLQENKAAQVRCFCWAKAKKMVLVLKF